MSQASLEGSTHEVRAVSLDGGLGHTGVVTSRMWMFQVVEDHGEREMITMVLRLCSAYSRILCEPFIYNERDGPWTPITY
ncbi:uncharacterized protein G2W53_034988 [Senna tora]|uniref:Uncharacterized protein n=1 Tax=Senna tora TaxID=362788 RepID=A0A834SSQ0_9FABA|nr:uncharacterized protein G2W53_034988 [Senna tora]